MGLKMKVIIFLIIGLILVMFVIFVANNIIIIEGINSFNPEKHWCTRTIWHEEPEIWEISKIVMNLDGAEVCFYEKGCRQIFPEECIKWKLR